MRLRCWVRSNLDGAPRVKPVVPPMKYPPTPWALKHFGAQSPEVSEGYPPAAKSAEATDFNPQQLRHGLRIHPRAKPVVFCVGGSSFRADPVFSWCSVSLCERIPCQLRLRLMALQNLPARKGPVFALRDFSLEVQEGDSYASLDLRVAASQPSFGFSVADLINLR